MARGLRTAARRANLGERRLGEVPRTLLLGSSVNRSFRLRRHARSVGGPPEGGPLPNHQERSSEAERWPQWQGESAPESEFDRKKGDREHRSGAQTTPQEPSGHDLKPTDDEERDEQRDGGSYSDCLERPPAVGRKPEERPDPTGRRE